MLCKGRKHCRAPTLSARNGRSTSSSGICLRYAGGLGCYVGATCRQPEVRMSMCPVLRTLVPFGIHRTCRIVAGLAACSASLPRKSKHGHTWPPPRARVGTVRKCLPAVERQVLLARQQRVFLTFDVAPIAPHQPAHTHGEIASTRTGSRSAGAASGMLPHLVQNCARRICLLLAQPTCRRTVR